MSRNDFFPDLLNKLMQSEKEKTGIAQLFKIIKVLSRQKARKETYAALG
jgi:hypothetical protein